MAEAEREGSTPESESTALTERPSTLRYRELLRGLEEAAGGVDETGKPAAPLLVALSALHKVLEFLRIDPAVVEGGHARALEMLHAALFDKMQGHKSHWLDSPHGEHVRSPASPLREYFVGQITAGVTHLTDTGMRTGEATKLIAQEAKTAGLRDFKGNAISARLIRNWHNRANDGKAAHSRLLGREDALAVLRRVIPKRLPGMSRQHVAQKEVREWLATLRYRNFAYPPPSHAKVPPPTSKPSKQVRVDRSKT